MKVQVTAEMQALWDSEEGLHPYFGHGHVREETKRGHEGGKKSGNSQIGVKLGPGKDYKNYIVTSKAIQDSGKASKGQHDLVYKKVVKGKGLMKWSGKGAKTNKKSFA